MDALLGPLYAYLPASSVWELLAVALALAYVLLAIKEKIACWFAAFFSTSIYIFLFWNVDLLMESALQVYYLAMAVYGWYQWQKFSDTEDALHIQTWTLTQHALAVSSVCLAAAASGYLLQQNTQAALPYIDSFTTWGAVVATYMVTKKVLENWLYWVVIDGVSIYLYIDRGLYPTTGLFVLYTAIALFGYLQWLKTYRVQVQCTRNV